MANPAAEQQAPSLIAKGVPIKLVIIATSVALLIGLGSAVVVYQLMGKPTTTRLPAVESGGAGQASTQGGMGTRLATDPPGAIVPLEPFIVNLADDPEIRYLKVSISLALDSPSLEEPLRARLAPIRDSILIFLSSKDSDDIRSADGKLRLRDEITRRVNALMPRPYVRNTYFTEFVIQ